MASEFGKWRVMADGPIAGSGQPETATLRSGTFTLPDGTAFQPLAVGVPVAIDDDNPETVIPTAVSCGVGGPACTFQAAFAHPHAGHFALSSGTGGLQEAINYEAGHGGGTVRIDPDWGGNLPTMLPLVKLPSSVLLIDERAGNWTVYGLGNGGEPQEIVSFSSASGTTLAGQATVNPPTLNGSVFAHAFNFPAEAPGTNLTAGVAVTLTPSWSLPGGVIAGDTFYLSGGTGTAEVVTLANVGTACPSGTTASVCFTPANSHGGLWSMASATGGLQEAVNAAGPGGWVIDDEGLTRIYAPLVIHATMRLSGFVSSVSHGIAATELQQMTPNTDVIQLGTPGGDAQAAQDVVIEHITARGVAGDGTDSGVAIHCLNCSRLELNDVKGTQAHDGLFFDSANAQAFVASVVNCHFIGNYYGVHIVGGSANRLTFTGNTVDANQYGVFDDGGWVHTWVGNDIEANHQYGYWQQVSNSAQWSGHNVVLHGNYFEANGTASGQGDVFLGQLVNGGAGNNGAGCINCEVSDNLFNATAGGQVTALNLGAVMMTVDDNTYSGYGAGKIYATIGGPDPNFSRVLMFGDCGTITAGNRCTESQPNSITQLGYGALTIGGTDQLTDKFGTELHDTTIESPTGVVRVRGTPGGAAPVNGALLDLDGNSTTVKFNEIKWRNQDVDEWGIKNDVTGANAHDFCLANDYANPSAATCDLYLNQQKRFKFSGIGVPGNVTLYGDYNFLQQANGDPGLVINRATDSAPAGYLLDIEDSTNSHPLLRVDATGNVSADGSLSVAGAATSTFAGPVAMGTGSSMGGRALNTDPGRVSGQSGTLFAGASFNAGQCLTGGISFTSGVSIGMALANNPESVPPAGLTWNAYIDAANHVTVRVCNATASPITWSSGAVWDVRVLP